MSNCVLCKIECGSECGAAYCRPCFQTFCDRMLALEPVRNRRNRGTRILIVQYLYTRGWRIASTDLWGFDGSMWYAPKWCTTIHWPSTWQSALAIQTLLDDRTPWFVRIWTWLRFGDFQSGESFWRSLVAMFIAERRFRRAQHPSRAALEYALNYPKLLREIERLDRDTGVKE